MAPAEWGRTTLTADLTRVMGCQARVTVVGGSPALLDLAENELRALEGLWSRFLPDSEISLLNLAAGRAVPVSARTRLLVRRLIDAHHATDGAFDPTLVLELVALGYGASRHDPARTTALPASVKRRGDVDRIVVDEDHEAVLLPEGTALDPGGLGKGLAADLVAETLLSHGARGALVIVGGDVRVLGTPPPGAAWTLDVEDPARPERTLRRIVVGDGGVATSSTLTRTWTDADGTPQHHVLDPVTGRPADGDLVGATVIAGSAAWAEALSTACLVMGLDEAQGLLRTHGVGGLLVTRDGRCIESPAWQEFVA